MERMQESFRPRIAITMGDPCGVGPEILVKMLARRGLVPEVSLLVIGDPGALKRASSLLKEEPDLLLLDDISRVGVEGSGGRALFFAPCELAEKDIRYGSPTAETSRAVIRYIECAARFALDGLVDAVCTCPIHKANLQRHGFQFPGHTEFLQDLTQTRDAVMMLAGPRLRVALATIHEALCDVPGLLSPELIRKTVLVTAEALSRDFGLKSPRIAVAGLNPHAGEEGRFGREEIEIIRPAIEGLKGSFFLVEGPFAPDTVFHRAFEGEFDAVVVMYHDQGLIPIKLVHFKEAVNVTLGMPIVRTSVDHGTAYDLAGTGKADEGSLIAAIHLAAEMVRNRLSGSHLKY